MGAPGYWSVRGIGGWCFTGEGAEACGLLWCYKCAGEPETYAIHWGQPLSLKAAPGRGGPDTAAAATSSGALGSSAMGSTRSSSCGCAADLEVLQAQVKDMQAQITDLQALLTEVREVLRMPTFDL